MEYNYIVSGIQYKGNGELWLTVTDGNYGNAKEVKVEKTVLEYIATIIKNRGILQMMKYINTLIICILIVFMVNKNTEYVEVFREIEIVNNKTEEYIIALNKEITRLDVTNNGLILLISEIENTPEFNVEDSKLLGSFEATAYTDDVESQGKWVGQTATGRKPQVGVIAVDPKVIPLETELYVEGYGYCVAGDVGGAIKGDRLDLFMNTRDECYTWGRKDVRVWRVD